MVSQKVKHSVVLALLFFVISSPWTYKLVDSIVQSITGTVLPSHAHLTKVAHGGCPTNYGLFVHAVAFGLVSYVLIH